jgi:hypothetical protein
LDGLWCGSIGAVEFVFKKYILLMVKNMETLAKIGLTIPLNGGMGKAFFRGRFVGLSMVEEHVLVNRIRKSDACISELKKRLSRNSF